MKPDRIVAAAAALCCLIVGAAALTAVRTLKAQSRVELTMSLTRQFDSDYKADRADCARAYLYAGKKKAKDFEAAPWRPIMDFFDVLGYLVETGAVDEEMAQYYLHEPLDGYYAATKNWLEKDRYRRALKLVDRWHAEKPKPELDRFFQDELDFTDPAPLEAGPKT